VKDSGGLGLAGTIMASMAGAMVGSYLMNKLMNNQNINRIEEWVIALLQFTLGLKAHLVKLEAQVFGSKNQSSSGLSKNNKTQSLKEWFWSRGHTVVDRDLGGYYGKLLPVNPRY